MRTRRLVSTIVATLLAYGLWVTPTLSADEVVRSQGGGSTAADEANLKSEAMFAAYESVATAAGALGFYTDGSGTFVVVVPTAIANDFPLGDTNSLGIPVRMESRNVTMADITKGEHEFAAIAADPQLRNASFVGHFSLEEGKLDVSGTASPATLQALLGRVSIPTIYTQHPSVGRSSRHSDTKPFFGGAETQLHLSPFDCTTGFTVKNAIGSRYMATAGHCFLLNESPHSPGSGQVQGQVVFRAPYPQKDMELLFLSGSPTYANKIYIGTTGIGTSVNGASNPVTGRPIYCHSGATTLTQCNHTVTDFTGMACDENGQNCTFNLMSFTGGNPTDFGDSGAPFYLPGTAVGIRGMVIGGDGVSQNVGDTWVQISSQFNVSIVTN